MNTGMILPMTLVCAGFSTAAGALIAVSLAHTTGHGDLAFGASAVGGALGSFCGWRLMGVKRPDPSKQPSVTDRPNGRKGIAQI